MRWCCGSCCLPCPPTAVPVQNLTYSQFLSDVSARQGEDGHHHLHRGRERHAGQRPRLHHDDRPVRLGGSGLPDRLGRRQSAARGVGAQCPFVPQVMSWLVRLVPFLFFG